jgi:prepilin-type N-terminal cleavage/methylation domain-containing protein
MRELRQTNRRSANFSAVRTPSPPGRIGFALLELLVVIAIILIITTLYWGGFSSAGYQNRKLKSCQLNLQKIFVAAQIYANDSHGNYPATNNAATAEDPLALLVPHYTIDMDLFICPGSKDSPLRSDESLRRQKISYAYLMGEQATTARAVLMSDREVDTEPKSPGQIVFSETGKAPGNKHYTFGGNFLFNDGSAESSPARIPF